ncbi:HEPN domain-containing protein [Brucepastera parasyntrophica]|uniref:HEPN domain-containing protein n=1 Tax=Brucepastera parasyntrophica TaxID=2880008 RepID=UPI00210DC871|nr:HEPN domain-containing protein [Brucepastera parasyntrophica]ULQ61025.1 HEPN domain-containing protein [Brucepastera parasyntrophica]
MLIERSYNTYMDIFDKMNIMNSVFDQIDVISKKLNLQIRILESSLTRFDNIIFDIRKVAQADLFDSEIDEAKELLKNSYFRAAGVIVGVLLEKHLKTVCIDHNIPFEKKNICISDVNDLLKKNDVIDVPTWRKIQHLTDLRNLCSHNKEKEPSSDEIDEMIFGVEKVIKTVY